MALIDKSVENSLLLQNKNCDKRYSSLNLYQHPSASVSSNITYSSPVSIASTTSLSTTSQDNNKSETSLYGKCKFMHYFSYIVIYMVYLLLGGMIFEILETSNELKMRQSHAAAKLEFMENNPCVSKDDLDKLISTMVKYSDHGITEIYDENDLNWSFNKAVFFSVTLINTIGYGHITPMTRNGKLFSMVYALIGIPLSLLLISTTVKRLMNIINILYWLIEYLLERLCRPFTIKLLHFSIIVAICSSAFLILPAFIFQNIEEWSYLDAFYFCFVSVSTIGLGDYVPGESLKQSYENKIIYRFFIGLYLVLGIISIMLILNLYNNIEEFDCGKLLVPAEGKNKFKEIKTTGASTTTTTASTTITTTTKRNNSYAHEYV